jgi:septum formation protein
MTRPQVMPSAPRPAPKLILASSSPYRRLLLERLGIAFETASPDIDEDPLPGESPEAMALRLAEAKARRIAAERTDALIIGSDQIAVLDGRILGKPGGRAAAVEQLLASSGRTLPFLTAICVLNAASGRVQLDMVPTQVTFRRLGRAAIEGYVSRDRPYACAGALQVERLGIALLERIDSEDPTALIGLPLIRLARMLEAEGIELFTPRSEEPSSIEPLS